MITKFCEAIHMPEGNWGKFMFQRFETEDFNYRSHVDLSTSRGLVARKWDSANVFITDLETGEGAIFRPGGLAAVDLDKHRIWVCPMFEPMLNRFYQNPAWWDLLLLPPVMEFAPGEAEFSFRGYRRRGDESTGLT